MKKLLSCKNGSRIKKQQTKTQDGLNGSNMSFQCVRAGLKDSGKSWETSHGRQPTVNERMTKKTGFNLCEENSSVLWSVLPYVNKKQWGNILLPETHGRSKAAFLAEGTEPGCSSFQYLHSNDKATQQLSLSQTVHPAVILVSDLLKVVCGTVFKGARQTLFI